MAIDLVAEYKAGKSLRELEQLTGVTYEWVRQRLIKTLGPNYKAAKHQGLAQRQLNTDIKKKLALEAKRFICRVCFKSSTRGGAAKKIKTCSPECSTLWREFRYHLDPAEKHKHGVAIAKNFIKNKTTVTKAQFTWAERFLAGKAKRRGPLKTSQRTQEALKRIMEMRQAR